MFSGSRPATIYGAVPKAPMSKAVATGGAPAGEHAHTLLGRAGHCSPRTMLTTSMIFFK